MRSPILTRVEGSLADPRRRALVGTGAVAALLVGVLSFAWPDRQAVAERDAAFALVGAEAVAAGAPGALASAHGTGVGGPFRSTANGGSRAPGRPCTPRREAIETLGSEESGFAPEEAVALLPLEDLPLEQPVLTLAEAAPAGPGGPFLPGLGSGGPPSVLPGTGGGGGGGGGGGPPVTPPVTPPTAIPEPGVWILMIAGFGLVGAAVRRKGWRPRQDSNLRPSV